MSVITLRPNAAGTYSEWVTNSYASVSDQDSPSLTYIHTNNVAGNKRSTYGLDNTGLSDGSVTVNSIKIRIKGATFTSGSDTLQGMLRISGSDYVSSTLTFTSSFGEYTWQEYTWTTNPNTGSAWTPSIIDGIEVGVKSITIASFSDLRVAEIEIVVDYDVTGGTPPTDPSLVSPQNNATIWTTYPNLVVSSVTGTGTITYQIQVDTTTGFNNIVSQISGVASGVPTSTGWQVINELTPSTTYYWRARASNGTDSNWSTVSGFSVGLFPSPTGLRCEFSTNTLVTGNGYVNFDAYFVGSGTGGNATYAQIRIMQTGLQSVAYPYIDTGWTGITSTSSGSRSSLIIYSGNIPSQSNTVHSGWYWNIRFKNASGVYSQWANAWTSDLFTGVQCPNQMIRSGISYGDEANLDPPNVQFSGNDPYGYVPWNTTVNMIARMSIRNQLATSYYGNCRLYYKTGYWPTPTVGDISNDTGMTLWGQNQSQTLFSGNTWNSFVISGNPTVNAISASGLTYTVQFYDGDTFGGGTRFDTEMRIDSIEFVCSGHKSFKMNRKIWVDQDKDERVKINFGSNHQALVSGNTVSFQLDTGAAKVIASNLPVESMPDAFSNVVYANGKTHIVYLGDYESSVSGYTIYIVTKDHATNTWGDPYFIDSAYTSNDTHHGPALCVDNQGYLHIFYGTHSAYTSEQLKYKRSVQPNKSGSGDDGTWTTVSSIAYPVTYPIPIVTKSGHIYVLYRTQNPNDAATYNETEPSLGYIYSTNNGTTWSGPMYFAFNPNSGRTYMHGFHYDKDIGRYHAAISFIDATNRSLGVWYAYTDDFVTWKTASGTTAGTASTNWSGNTLMSGTNPNQPSLVAASTNKYSVFGRPIIVDNNGVPHVFATSDQTRAPFYQYYFPIEEQAIYFPASLNHYYYNSGTNTWSGGNVSETIDAGAWAANYSIKPLIDEDNNISLYINEKPLREYTIQPSVSGTYSDFIASSGLSYNCINTYRDIYDETTYISLSGSLGKSTFSGNFSNVPTGYINCLSVEGVVEKYLYGATSFCYCLVVSGVVYSGNAFSWYDIWRNSNYTEYSGVPYIQKWYLNPHTNLPWERTALDNIEFGIAKITATGTIKCFDLVCRVETINNSHDEQFAGEVVRLTSRDNGINWGKEYITNYSQYGIPQLSIKNDFSNNQLEMIWAAGNKLYYYNIDKTNHYNNDGSDIRLYWGNQEIDRIADRWNNDTTTIEFKIQSGIPIDAGYGDKDYYVYNLDRDSSYAKDNPKNIYRFYESWEDYPGITYFPGTHKFGSLITKKDLVYNPALSSDTYDAAEDAKDENNFNISGMIVSVYYSMYQNPASVLTIGGAVRVSNSSTYDSSKVMFTGSFAGGPLVTSGVDFGVNYFTGINTTSGASIKLDFNSVDPPSASGQLGPVFVDDVFYIHQLSGWVPVSGYCLITDSPPYGPAAVFAGGKTLLLKQNNTILKRTIGTGINNVYVEFSLRPFRFSNTQNRRHISIGSGTSQFAVGVYISTAPIDDPENYKYGPIYYMSGSTYTDTSYIVGDQAWYKFKVLVRSGLCDAWWGDKQLCTGINALPSGFNDITVSGGSIGDSFDYIKIYDYIEDPPEITYSNKEYKCINFLAAIQGKSKLLIGFNYVISGIFVDSRKQIWHEHFMQVLADSNTGASNLTTKEYNEKIITEYQGFTLASIQYPIEINKLINNDSRLSVEYIGEKEFYSKYNVTYNKELEFDSQLYYCGTKSLELDNKIPIEYGNIVASLCNIANGYVSNIEANANLFHEYSNEVIAFAKIINGYLVGKLFDFTLSVEDISSIKNDFNVVSSWLKNIENNNKLNIDYLSISHLYCNIITGYIKMLENDSSIIPSWLSNVASDHDINYEHLSSILSVDSNLPIEYGYGYGNSICLPSEYLQKIESDHKLTFNWLGTLALNLDSNIPIDFLGSVSYDSNISLDYLENKEYLNDIPFEFAGNLIVDTKLPVSSLKTIDGFSEFCLSAQKEIENKFNILTEQLISAGANLSNIPIEYLKELTNDFNLGVDFTGTAAIELYLKIPIEYTVRLNNYGNINISNTKLSAYDNIINASQLSTIDSKNKVNIDYLKLINSIYKNVPIDVLSSILSNYNISIDSLSSLNSDSIVSLENLNQLISDSNLPIDITAAGDYIIGGQNIPISWISSIESDNKINLENLSDIVYSFDNKIIIDYGTGFSRNIKLPEEFGNGFSAFVNVLNTWLNSVDGKAKITFENIAKINSDVNFRFDFGKNFVASSKIPFERMLQVLSDKKIPIWEKSALIEAFLFKNISFVYPNLANINISYPELKNLLINSILTSLTLSGPEVEKENITNPSISGQNFIGQSS